MPCIRLTVRISNALAHKLREVCLLVRQILHIIILVCIIQSHIMADRITLLLLLLLLLLQLSNPLSQGRHRRQNLRVRITWSWRG